MLTLNLLLKELINLCLGPKFSAERFVGQRSHASPGLFTHDYRIKHEEVLFLRHGNLSAWSNNEDTMRRPYGYAHSHKKSSITFTCTHVQWVDPQLLYFLRIFQPF